MILPDLTFERRHAGPVAGIDEAGRTAIAGPIIAAAVILPQMIPKFVFVAINESRRISPLKRRAAMIALIQAGAQTAIGASSTREVERFGAAEATMLAMQRATARLPSRPAHVLVHGSQIPNIDVPTTPLIKGTAISLSIAAASIVAQLNRDRIMAILSARHSVYGWVNNAGYSTNSHLTSLAEHGPSQHHRHTPVRLDT